YSTSQQGRNKVTVSASGEDERLVLTVTNSYRNENVEDRRPTSGMGLRVTRERLSTIYGKRFTMTSGADTGGNWVTCLQIPKETFMEYSNG
ncbi:MAG: hypothetical protein ACREQ5_31540, partial [Candidatus Dormibacteria bacterium]